MSNSEKPDPFPNSVIMDVHRATGLSVPYCRRILEDASSSLLYPRLLEAINRQWGRGTGGLHDPIEDQIEFAEAIQSARKMAEAELEPELGQGRRMMGDCHTYCSTQKRILREQYDIEWFSPAEMDPWITFD